MEKLYWNPGKTPAAIYDGDTPQSKRAAIRENSRIVYIQPARDPPGALVAREVEPVFSHPKFVVIDEAHRYRGIFGSQIALLIRSAVAGGPCIWLRSAVCPLNGNPCKPGGVCRATRRAFTLVDTDGSPHGTRTLSSTILFLTESANAPPTRKQRPTSSFPVSKGISRPSASPSRKMAELYHLGTGGCPVTHVGASCPINISVPGRLPPRGAAHYRAAAQERGDPGVVDQRARTWHRHRIP